jgi:ribonuclease HI
MELVLEDGVEAVSIFGDSNVMINQLMGDINYASDALYPYFNNFQELMARFYFITLTWVPWEHNLEANGLAK